MEILIAGLFGLRLAWGGLMFWLDEAEYLIDNPRLVHHSYRRGGWSGDPHTRWVRNK